MPRAPQNLCIYCGGAVGRVKKGEHVVPDALGGRITIKSVCGACNNTFSDIDRELCSRSPLSIIASQDIDANLWEVWDIDHSDRNLLLEARPDWPNQSLTLYPQMVFDSSGFSLRADLDEMNRFGRDAFQNVFVKSLRRAFHSHESKEANSLHFERIGEVQTLGAAYRLPPRAYARKSLRELVAELNQKKPGSFLLRYRTESERRMMLNTLDNWDSNGRFRRSSAGLGSHLPVIGWSYDSAKVLRCLFKIAVNLLAHVCRCSEINLSGLKHVISIIKGESPVSLNHLQESGFIDASGLGSFPDHMGAHAFRIQSDGNVWHIASSYFGGRIGSYVRFHGQNREDWNYAEIVAPIGAADWRTEISSILRPMSFRVEWLRPQLYMPSVKLENVSSVFATEINRERSKRRR